MIFEWPLSCRSLGSCDLWNERAAIVHREGNVTSMKLEMMAEEDVKLRVRQETDPQMMAELGGPRPREAIERAHAKSLALAAEGRCWPLKIIPDGASSPAGGVDVFESSHDDEAIYEIGWMILPEFQNRGLAASPCGRFWRRRGWSGSSGRSTPFPRSRTALPTRSARRTASRTWEVRGRVRRVGSSLQPPVA